MPPLYARASTNHWRTRARRAKARARACVPFTPSPRAVVLVLVATHRHTWLATPPWRRRLASPPLARGSSTPPPLRSWSSSIERAREQLRWCAASVVAEVDARSRAPCVAKMARESQWEHQAKFAGELFMGTACLVGAFLTFMYCHLKARRDERLAAQRERLLRPTTV
jgi:hypothetical protein